MTRSQYVLMVLATNRAIAASWIFAAKNSDDFVPCASPRCAGSHRVVSDARSFRVDFHQIRHLSSVFPARSTPKASSTWRYRFCDLRSYSIFREDDLAAPANVFAEKLLREELSRGDHQSTRIRLLNISGSGYEKLVRKMLASHMAERSQGFWPWNPSLACTPICAPPGTIGQDRWPYVRANAWSGATRSCTGAASRQRLINCSSESRSRDQGQRQVRASKRSSVPPPLAGGSNGI